MLDINLMEKVVVITGASGRLGQRLVSGFAEYGATVAAIVRTEEHARNIPFPDYAEGWAFYADLLSEVQTVGVFQQIVDQLGRIDIVVHAVGTWEASPLTATSSAAWDRIIATNLTSTFHAFREGARYMEDEGGVLIAFASRQGTDGGTAEQAAYSAAKAGVIRLVESTAAEYAGSGLRAYAVAPSTIAFDEGAPGVPVTELVDLCIFLSTPAGRTLNGRTLRAYGDVVAG